MSYDQSGSRRRHIEIIRTHHEVRPFAAGGAEVMGRTTRQAARTREDLRDLINAAVEELVRHRFELPAFSTLVRDARQARFEVNQGLYAKVTKALRPDEYERLGALFDEPGLELGTTAWNRVKRDPGKATLTNLRNLTLHHRWLNERQPSAHLWTLLPDAKLRRFAAEAESLNASQMREMEPAKRAVLAACLLHSKAARVLDDLGELFIKRMMAVHRKGKDALFAYQREHQQRADDLIHTLKELLDAYQGQGSEEDRFEAMSGVIAHRIDELQEQCAEHGAYADNNYLPFLWRYYASHRPTLYRLTEFLPLRATSQDDNLLTALRFIRSHQKSRAAWLSLEGEALDLSWVGEKWRPLVTGEKRRVVKPEKVDRRHFEVCVFSQLVWELKSGDICIDGSLEFADYRAQLLDDEAYAEMVEQFGVEVGLPVHPKAFVTHTWDWLHTAATRTDLTFPENHALDIEKGQPTLKRLRKGDKRPQTWLKKRVKEALDQMNVPILDALADSEMLVNWSQFFGPLSGYEAKLADRTARYLQTAFCYGCNIGPSQTARSLEGADRRQISWVNQRHISEDTLDRAMTHLINAYNRFSLPKLWGSGRSVSADGTKWDVYEKNLLAEYHIRYGGYGGIGYNHVSDTYVALFSHFIPCGVVEAVYILDGLLSNESDIRPDMVHSDTHGQTAPVFGLAYLLGIDLMPRIRDWHGLTFVKADKSVHYEHIDALFTDTVDWYLIERHLPDMLRIVLSIKAGRVNASTILKRLSSYSRKNHVYQAFRELGKVIRTGFLLRYLADAELRDTSAQTRSTFLGSGSYGRAALGLR